MKNEPIEKEELPPLIQYLIRNLTDKSQNHYQRQNYRDRLQAMATVMNEALAFYADETTAHEKNRRK